MLSDPLTTAPAVPEDQQITIPWDEAPVARGVVTPPHAPTDATYGSLRRWVVLCYTGNKETSMGAMQITELESLSVMSYPADVLNALKPHLPQRRTALLDRPKL